MNGRLLFNSLALRFSSMTSAGLALVLLFVTSVSATNDGLRITPNKGQWDAHILCKAALQNGTVYFEQNQVTFSFYDLQNEKHHHSKKGEEGVSNWRGHSYQMNFIGANPEAKLETSGILPAHTNYFIGNDPQRWASEVYAYSLLSYRALYPGIDLKIYEHNGNLKYDVIVESGADPSLFRTEYKGQDKIALKRGELQIETTINKITEKKPIAWQMIDGRQVMVACEFVLENNVVSFRFPKGYDSTHPLTIDPELIFSTYTGSTSDNWGYTATYDDEGFLYAGGISFAPGYPITPGAFRSVFAGGVGNYPTDISITKFSKLGNALVYSTFIGGNANELPHSMVVDPSGQLIVYGTTGSANYPTTINAYNRTYNGGASVVVDNVIEFPQGSDIIVTKFSANGSSLIGSTYLGGSDNDGLNLASVLSYNYGDHARGEVICDPLGNAYVASCTYSSDFPFSTAAFDSVYSGNQDGCVFKLSADMSTLIWSSYLGGAEQDAAYSLKRDSAGSVYVCGGTSSLDFPVTAGTINPTYLGGVADAFLARLSDDGTTLLNATFAGTNSYDQAFFVEVDIDEDIYIYGQSRGEYPVTSGVYQNPGGKQFIHKLDKTFSSTLFSTVFGSGGSKVNISPTAFLLDLCKKIYISGWGGEVNNSFRAETGNTTGMAITPNAFQSNTDGSDFYFMVLDTNATSLLYATYFGGNNLGEHVDGGTSRFDKKGVIYQAVCAGCGGNSQFPTSPGAWSTTNNSPNCNLGAIKFRIQLSGVEMAATPEEIGCAPLEVNFQSNAINANLYDWDFGDGSSSQAANPSHTFINPGTYTVTVIAYDTLSCHGLAFSDTNTLIIKVGSDNFFVNAGTDSSVCSSAPFVIGSSGNPGITYKWTPSSGLSNDTISNPVYSPATSTQYILTASNGFCSKTDTVTMTVDTILPVAAFQVSYLPSCDGMTAVFSNSSSGASQYFWDFGDGKNSTEQNPKHVYAGLMGKVITLIASNSAGCSDTLLLDHSGLNFEEDLLFKVPNVFTPDGDGLNECFVKGVDSTFSACFDLKVYNRWGTQLFKSGEGNYCWDGKTKGGKEVPEGTYYYVMRLGKHDYHGHVMLLRK